MKSFIFGVDNPHKPEARLIDALKRLHGPMLHLVEVSDRVDCIAEFDATDVIRKFACNQALINVELIKSHCKEEQYEYIVDYLSNGNGDRAKVCGLISDIYSYIEIKYEDPYNEDVNSPEILDAAQSIHSAVISDYSAYTAAFYASEATECKIDYKLNDANEMLTSMIKEATGWSID